MESVTKLSEKDPKTDKKKNSERRLQTTAPFHAPAEEKETAKSGWVCGALYLCCPRLICDSLQPWWNPTGAGRGFSNLPVSETDVRLQSGGHMGWRRKIESVCMCKCGGGMVVVVVRSGGGVDNDDDDEKRLVRLWEGKLVCRAKLNVAHNGISRTLPERNAHNGAAGSLVSRWFVQSENTITGDHETVVTLRLTRLDLVHSLKKAASKKM